MLFPFSDLMRKQIKAANLLVTFNLNSRQVTVSAVNKYFALFRANCLF